MIRIFLSLLIFCSPTFGAELVKVSPTFNLDDLPKEASFIEFKNELVLPARTESVWLPTRNGSGCALVYEPSKSLRRIVAGKRAQIKKHGY